MAGRPPIPGSQAQASGSDRGVCLLTGLLLLSIFYWQIFPVAYVDGAGLTAFKIVSEYAISLLFLGSIGTFLAKRREFDPDVPRLLVLSLTLTIASELAFTSYVSVYGEANLIGHLLRLVAWYVMYKAIIETGLVKPYSILLRDLKSSQDQLTPTRLHCKLGTRI